MHGAQGSVGVAAIMAFFFFTAAFSSQLDRCGFHSGCWNYISHTSLFLSAGFLSSQIIWRKKKQVSCGKIWSASWSYVYVMHIERVLGRCWNRGKHHVNLACVVTLPSFECTAVCLAGVLRQWEREKSRKTDMKLIGEITHEMMVISNETCWVNFQA